VNILITDLVQIRRLGEKMKDENLRFRRYLKDHHYNERKLRNIAQDIEEQTDCTACANCCKVASVRLLERDIEKLAKFFRTTVAKFTAEYVETDESGDRVLRRTPEGCVFLSGNECTVYEARPSNCVNFPHLVRGEGPISTRMWQFVDRATYCPIVFNSIEAFKDETRFPGRTPVR
jgi:Fe-S-cluster containining protein